ncbi:hypothetical protein B9Z19DRAFT_625672 [Tuber borchii]|uniref:Uncharacterized protein n=1 Tax=Tuber borchii TaxID=42251 RepID=A0A2T7A0M0_TUBBO|nr:hypothetical protein B9Z19DRAFT_625672 [Tuber borchii]
MGPGVEHEEEEEGEKAVKNTIPYALRHLLRAMTLASLLALAPCKHLDSTLPSGPSPFRPCVGSYCTRVLWRGSRTRPLLKAFQPTVAFLALALALPAVSTFTIFYSSTNGWLIPQSRSRSILISVRFTLWFITVRFFFIGRVRRTIPRSSKKETEGWKLQYDDGEEGRIIVMIIIIIIAIIQAYRKITRRTQPLSSPKFF